MKSNPKIKIIILITLGILFAFSPIITINLSFITDNNNISSENSNDINLDTENLKLSAVSGRISISYNSGWVNIKNAGNCTGSGTESDPYVIKDLVIDAGGSDFTSGIQIIGSNVYFRIENCRVYNSGSQPYDAGIFLTQVSNGLLTNNDVSNNNYYGIYLEESSNNTIFENKISYGKHSGIYLYMYCSNNSLLETISAI